MPTCDLQFVLQCPAPAHALLQRDESSDALALDLVGPADDGGFGDCRMADQGALDFHRAEAVAGDVDDVVDAAHDPEVAVLVAAGAVAGEVDAGDLAPVLLLEALGVAVDGAQHRRARAFDHEKAACVGGTDLPLSIDDIGDDAGKRRVAEPGLVGTAPGSGEIMIAPVSVCHQVSTIGQRSPPISWWYHIQASGLIGSPTVPSRRRLDRSCFAGHCIAPLDEGADGGRRRVEDVDLVLLDDAPEAVRRRDSSARLRT